MGLIAHIGKRQEVNDIVTCYALEHPSAVLIDCANSADAHRYHGRYSKEELACVHVMSIDLLYSYPDVLRQAPRYLHEKQANTLCITTAKHLFNYQDEDENTDIRKQVWELLAKLGNTYDVHVAVEKNSPHIAWAKTYAKMGHTTSSQRQVSNDIIKELKEFIKALPAAEQERAKQLLNAPLQRLGAITSASSLHTWAFLLLCIILEAEKHGSWTSFETKKNS